MSPFTDPYILLVGVTPEGHNDVWSASMELLNFQIRTLQWSERTCQFSEELVLIKNVIIEPLDQRSGIKVYFLPSIMAFMRCPDLCDKFSNHFAIPRYFWTNTAYEANGFFGSRDYPLDNFTAKSTQCRFLIKRLINNQINYEWLFMAFSTLWYTFNGKESQILLCFDLSEEITDAVITSIKASNPTHVFKCPFAIYDILLSPISKIYDESLWEFRIPIRDIEKSRSHYNGSMLKIDQYSKYEKMHELWRHIIHVHETVSSAIKTVAVLKEQHGECCEKSSSCYGDIHLYVSILGNVQLRAGSFEKRIQNEISLAFNLAAAADNDLMKTLARTSQITAELALRDSHTMKKIAVLTLFFLPATFVSAVFSMSFFNYTPGTDGQDGKWSVSENFWVYWAVAAPVTAVSVFMWFLWSQVLPQSTMSSLSTYDPGNKEKMASD